MSRSDMRMKWRGKLTLRRKSGAPYLAEIPGCSPVFCFFNPFLEICFSSYHLFPFTFKISSYICFLLTRLEIENLRREHYRSITRHMTAQAGHSFTPSISKHEPTSSSSNPQKSSKPFQLHFPCPFVTQTFTPSSATEKAILFPPNSTR